MEKQNVDSAMQTINNQIDEEKKKRLSQQNFLKSEWNLQNQMLKQKVRVEQDIESED